MAALARAHRAEQSQKVTSYRRNFASTIASAPLPEKLPAEAGGVALGGLSKLASVLGNMSWNPLGRRRAPTKSEPIKSERLDSYTRAALQLMDQQTLGGLLRDVLEVAKTTGLDRVAFQQWVRSVKKEATGKLLGDLLPKLLKAMRPVPPGLEEMQAYKINKVLIRAFVTETGVDEADLAELRQELLKTAMDSWATPRPPPRRSETNPHSQRAPQTEISDHFAAISAALAAVAVGHVVVENLVQRPRWPQPRGGRGGPKLPPSGESARGGCEADCAGGFDDPISLDRDEAPGCCIEKQCYGVDELRKWIKFGGKTWPMAGGGRTRPMATLPLNPAFKISEEWLDENCATPRY